MDLLRVCSSQLKAEVYGPHCLFWTWLWSFYAVILKSSLISYGNVTVIWSRKHSHVEFSLFDHNHECKNNMLISVTYVYKVWLLRDTFHCSTVLPPIQNFIIRSSDFRTYFDLWSTEMEFIIQKRCVNMGFVCCHSICLSAVIWS